MNVVVLYFVVFLMDLFLMSPLLLLRFLLSQELGITRSLPTISLDCDFESNDVPFTQDYIVDR